jgi:hypothetical protein
MSTLVAIDGILYDLESSPDTPDGVSALVGEAEREDEGWRDAEGPDEPRPDAAS